MKVLIVINLNVQIGDEAFGGIVFYIDELSNYGLVAAEQDADIDNISMGVGLLPRRISISKFTFLR